MNNCSRPTLIRVTCLVSLVVSIGVNAACMGGVHKEAQGIQNAGICLAERSAGLDVPEHTGDAPLDRFEQEIRAYEAADLRHMPPAGETVFVGSSTFAMMGRQLEKQFLQYQAINRGFGGSTLPEITYYARRIVTRYHPRQIIVYAGANDAAAGHDGRQIALDFARFVNVVRGELPDVDIIFVSMILSPARMHVRRAYEDGNRLIAEFIRQDPLQRLHYVDVTNLMSAHGQPRADLFRTDDCLHLNEAGYAQLWPSIEQAMQLERKHRSTAWR